ncbi:hypothetical protein KA089_00945 [Candidatus Woesebacteria bacterium]|nr:hypothetical protein [Candidatus Woesebacteria bacterium]
MKIYFTSSARGISDFKTKYGKIFQSIEKLGHKNLDDLVLTIDKDVFYDGTHNDQTILYEKTIKFIKKCDIVILEVTIPSLSMGYVLHKSLEMNKPVIALYQPGNPPFFAQGIENDKLQVIEYTDNDVEQTLKDAIEYAQGKADVRFNFFISPSIGNYLDWISKVKKIPRSVYLRGLIEKDQEDNDEYTS